MRGRRREGPRATAPALALLLLLTALPLVPGAAPLASAEDGAIPNVLIYPGFEHGRSDPDHGRWPYYWDAWPFELPDGTEMGQAWERHHNGSYSAFISISEWSTEGEVRWTQVRVADPGDRLPVGGWVLADVSEDATVLLRARVMDGLSRTILTVEGTLEGPNGVWTELSAGSLTVPEEADRIRFECVLKGVGQVWFDDVYLGEPTDMGNPPIIVSVPPVEAAVGHEYSYLVRAVDMDMDPTSFALVQGPEGMAISGEGAVTWTPQAIPDEAVRVVIRASDPTNHSTHQDFFVRVSEEPVERPVHVMLYSSYDDHVNDGISGERYQVLLPQVEALRQSHPEMRPSVTVFFNGVDVKDATGTRAAATASVVDARSSGWAEVGYTAVNEPTHENNPLHDPGYGDLSWAAMVQAVDGLLSRPRDPLTGEWLGTGAGGLVAVEGALGPVEAVFGVGSDGAQLHALARHDDGAVQLGLSSTPAGTLVPPYIDSRWGTLADMLAEDPGVPYGLLWEGGRLRLTVVDSMLPTGVASSGAEQLEWTTDRLDRGRSHVVPVLVMETGTYCNGSVVVGGHPVVDPTTYAYLDPGEPALPEEAVRSPSERAALYDATNGTLDWLAGSYLPSTGGRFVSAEGLADMVDPGTGTTVPASELATASADLLERARPLDYPYWLNVQWGYCRGDVQYFSLAEMYGMLVEALAAFNATGEVPASVDMGRFLGPSEEWPPAGPWEQVRLGPVIDEAARQADDLLDAGWAAEPGYRVPSHSSPMGREINAMEFLHLMAGTYLYLYEGGEDRYADVRVRSTLQYPLTWSAMEVGRERHLPSDSWEVKPASTNLQQDDVPPTVRHVSPTPGSEDVSLDAGLTVTFSERMDEGLSLEGALVASPPIEGELEWRYHRLVLDPDEDLGDNTTYTVTVRRTLVDASGNPLAANYTWNFTTLSLENEPPVLTPMPPDSDVEVLENRSLRLSVLAEDESGGPLEFGWLLDGVEVPNAAGDWLEYVPGYTDEGEHTITVVVTDTAPMPKSATFTWNVTVVNVNLLAELVGSSPPSPVTVSETEEGSLTLHVDATDPDEGVLAFEWEVDGEMPPGEDVLDDGATLAFRYGYESAGTHLVVCRVSDRVEEAFEVTWSIEVLDVNRPPVIHSLEPTVPPTIELADTYEFEVNATDPDGDEVRFLWYLDGEPVGNTTEGSWVFTPTEDGSFSIRVQVEDGRGGSVEGLTGVNVLPQEEPRPDPVPEGSWAWALVLLVIIAIVAAVVWPLLRRREL